VAYSAPDAQQEADVPLRRRRPTKDSGVVLSIVCKLRTRVLGTIRRPAVAVPRLDHVLTARVLPTGHEQSEMSSKPPLIPLPTLGTNRGQNAGFPPTSDIRLTNLGRCMSLLECDPY
jgi:hypothetical protein